LGILYIDDLRNTLDELLLKDESIYIIGEDIAEPYGGAFKVTKGLSTKYPGRLISTPMSEQSFTGLGIGMSLNNLKPIVEIMFGDFITLLADQIINHIAKFYDMYNLKTNFVVRTPSGGYRGYGATHSQSLEKIFLGIPGIKVISPSVLNHPGSLLAKAINLGMPVLFIENKLDYSRKLIENGTYKDIINIISNSKSDFPMVIARIIDENPEVTIISYGGLIQIIIEVIEQIFMEEEVSVELISISDISHINFEELNDLISTDNILIIEESHVDFGWGNQIVANLIKRSKYKNIENVGAKLSYIPAAKALENNVLIQKCDIIDIVLEMVGRNE